jgi:hypothetical protein
MKNVVQISDSFDQEERLLLMIKGFAKTVKPKHLPGLENLLWLLVPWVVFAAAAGLKFWRLTSLFRKHRLGISSRTERFRQALERIWFKDHSST